MDMNFSELFNNQGNELLEKAKSMEKPTDFKDLDRPIAKMLDNRGDYDSPETEEKNFGPNSTYEIDGNEYETDGDGNIYKMNGDLLPNTTYEQNGNKYTTDENGRIKETTSQETPSHRDEFSSQEVSEYVSPEGYNSTYDERLKQTPKEDSDRGEWEGERGESKFIPNDKEIKDILEKYGLDGITYENGIPDFSEVSESTVEIDNMTENRAENFKQCDEKCAEQWNKEARDGKTDWTARDVAQWRKENGYTWHERNDMKTCDLVPTEINDYFGHLGGVSECRKRDTDSNGGDFDD